MRKIACSGGVQTRSNAVIVIVTGIHAGPGEDIMKRTLTALVTAALALGLTLAVTPVATGGGFSTTMIGSSGCCKQ